MKRVAKRSGRTLVREVMAGELYEYYPLGQHIVVAPGVCGGRPTFKYTRIDVRHALGLIATGHTVEQVASGYGIPLQAVQEAIELAAGVFDRYGGKQARQA